MRKMFFAIALLSLLSARAFAHAEQTAELTITWEHGGATAEAPLDGFILERRAGQTGNFSEIAKPAAATRSHKDVIANDAGGSEYCYRIAAFNNQGNSAWSNVACATTPVIVVAPGAPANVKVTVTVTINQ